MRMVDPELENTPVVEDADVSEKIDADVGDSFFLIKKEDLITRGKLYPKNKNIFFRTMIVPEVKRLANILMSEENAEYIVNDTLKKCLKGIDIDDLFVEDKMYLLFYLRASTFKDSSYVVDFHCDKCGKESGYHFTIGNLRANFIADDYDPNKKYVLQNGDELTLTYIKVRDQKEMENLKDSAIARKSDKLDDEFLAIAASIFTINGNKMPLVARYDYVVNKLTPEDYSDLQTILEKHAIGIEPMMDVVCQECGGAGSIPVTFHPRFFLPKRKF